MATEPRALLLTQEDAARELGVGRDQLRAWQDASLIGYVLVGQDRRTPRLALERFCAAVAAGQVKEATPKPLPTTERRSHRRTLWDHATPAERRLIAVD